jgi:hypothetical protein
LCNKCVIGIWLYQTPSATLKVLCQSPCMVCVSYLKAGTQKTKQNDLELLQWAFWSHFLQRLSALLARTALHSSLTPTHKCHIIAMRTALHSSLTPTHKCHTLPVRERTHTLSRPYYEYCPPWPSQCGMPPLLRAAAICMAFCCWYCCCCAASRRGPARLLYEGGYIVNASGGYIVNAMGG